MRPRTLGRVMFLVSSLANNLFVSKVRLIICLFSTTEKNWMENSKNIFRHTRAGTLLTLCYALKTKRPWISSLSQEEKTRGEMMHVNKFGDGKTSTIDMD